MKRKRPAANLLESPYGCAYFSHPNLEAQLRKKLIRKSFVSSNSALHGTDGRKAAKTEDSECDGKVTSPVDGKGMRAEQPSPDQRTAAAQQFKRL
ncbi:hypothetical protein [Ensifer aridi]|uniref:hypothetical protein n=1 Tax=Ensifer aridi TaxID=1708715 RepID=UPI000614E8D7|nr:hypothetical protein [Ensifer aridi]